MEPDLQLTSLNAYIYSAMVILEILPMISAEQHCLSISCIMYYHYCTENRIEYILVVD